MEGGGAVSEVIGVARRPETIEEAVRAGAVDWGTLDLAEGVREADVVILAPPVAAIVPLFRALKPHLKPGADRQRCREHQGAICRTIWQEAKGHALYRRPSHGRIREGGVLAADPYLFQNAPYILVPPDDAPAECDRHAAKPRPGHGGAAISS